MRSRVSSIGLIVRPNPASGYCYPDHIDRASLDALPREPGVYLFVGHDGEPVYIGKSVCLRSRVLSHLRTPEEAAMLRDTARIDFVRTAGDIGALLLESRLIKQMQPPYNALLRMVRDTYALGLDAGAAAPAVCSSGTRRPGRQLFGLFGSRASAEEALRALARRHGLCPALLGLEAMVCKRGCFSRQLGRCNGACIGAETAEQHAARLRAALAGMQEAVWPFAGAVGIVERGAGMRQVHVVDRWAYLGSLEGRRRRLARSGPPLVDIDTYKILAAPLLGGSFELVQCTVQDGLVTFVG
ncbi:endonuclease [Noviherbaspirillum suwonense]|jgi:excinuclease Cho|uniref:Excinuclease cho n=1 Tax=Noviherbaspirillum suwonense TaxID=1224511 RepID=A0ABY1PUY2_9BURK|nr:endonuclease [Noviherbaspirillum suwonense]SMP49595.1 Excinuclease Cho [Noviherbaspirillum suwonense]